MRIREARHADGETVVRLIGELAHSVDEPSALSAAHVAHYLDTPGSAILLAEYAQPEEESRAVGLISYSIRPNLYHAAHGCLIEELVVTREARGRGVGSALLQAVIERAKEARCAEISIGVMPDNRQAVALYRRLGFVDEALLLEQHIT